jgi:hypothetical protein
MFWHGSVFHVSGNDLYKDNVYFCTLPSTEGIALSPQFTRVACFSSGTLHYSTNSGADWSSHALPQGMAPQAFFKGEGLYCTSMVSMELQLHAWSGSQWDAVGGSQPGINIIGASATQFISKSYVSGIRTSTDGTTWTDEGTSFTGFVSVMGNSVVKWYGDDNSFRVYTIASDSWELVDAYPDYRLCPGSFGEDAFALYNQEQNPGSMIWIYTKIPALPTNVTEPLTIDPVNGMITLVEDMTVEATGDLVLNVFGMSGLAGGKTIEVKAGGKLRLGSGLQITVLSGTRYKLIAG